MSNGICVHMHPSRICSISSVCINFARPAKVLHEVEHVQKPRVRAVPHSRDGVRNAESQQTEEVELLLMHLADYSVCKSQSKSNREEESDALRFP